MAVHSRSLAIGVLAVALAGCRPPAPISTPAPVTPSPTTAPATSMAAPTATSARPTSEDPMPTQPASQPTPDPGVMLFDFRQAGRVDYWAVVNDGVMGGVSDSRISWLEDTAMLFAGTVRLENNGGFASVQASFAPFDASDFDGIALDVRGDGLRYGFYLRDARFGAVRFQTNFETEAGSWQTVRLPFTSFEPLRLGTPVEAAPLDLSQLSGAAFIISDKQAGPFALEVGAIRLTAGP